MSLGSRETRCEESVAPPQLTSRAASLARAGEGAEASAKETGSIAEGARAGLNYERHGVSHHHRADPSRLRVLADVSKVRENRARKQKKPENYHLT